MAASLTKNIFLALLLTFFTTAYAAPATAVKGGCEKPVVRREWRALSADEREEYANAVKCLNKVPHKSSLTTVVNLTVAQIPPINPNTSHFDDFVYTHMDLNPVIHFTGLFLPWHRAYVADFELALRTECGYTGGQPYWDWTLDASPNFPNATIWNDSPTSGLGGWGDPNNDFRISTGVFSKDLELAYPAPHTIRRNYTDRSFSTDPFGDGTPPAPLPFWNYITPASRDALVDNFIGDFVGFHTLFEGPVGPHGSIHVMMGGDMSGTCPNGLAPPACVQGPKWTSNDPMFFMHHSMIDKMWWDWQNKHPQNFWSYGGGSVGAHTQPGLYAEFPTGGPPFLNFSSPLPTDGILRDGTIYDMMDIKAERLCYTYE